MITIDKPNKEALKAKFPTCAVARGGPNKPKPNFINECHEEENFLQETLAVVAVVPCVVQWVFEEGLVLYFYRTK